MSTTPTRTHIDFAIRGPNLSLAVINKELALTATDGFDPCSEYEGKEKQGDRIVPVKRIRPNFGVWHYCTEAFVTSENAEEHFEYLLKRLEPVKERIARFLEAPEWYSIVSVWYFGSTGFDVHGASLKALSEFTTTFVFRFTLQDDDER